MRSVSAVPLTVALLARLYSPRLRVVDVEKSHRLKRRYPALLVVPACGFVITLLVLRIKKRYVTTVILFRVRRTAVAVRSLLLGREWHDDNPVGYHRSGPDVDERIRRRERNAFVPSNVAKGVAPIAAASIWNFTRGYVAVEWTVFLVSILSVTAFFLAVRVSRHATTALRDISRLRVQHSYIRHEDTCRTK